MNAFRWRTTLLTVAAWTLAAGLAISEPAVEVRVHDGVPQIVLEGQYPQSRYSVLRAATRDGLFEAITARDALCLGPCFADDRNAVPGETYWYRFDLTLADGRPVRFGPYRVTVPAPSPHAMDARVYPNPSRGAATIELYLRGAANESPLAVEATIHDLQGRRLRTLERGSLPRGTTTLRWDGRDEAGRLLGSGHFFLRLSSPLGVRVTRILRVR